MRKPHVVFEKVSQKPDDVHSVREIPPRLQGGWVVSFRKQGGLVAFLLEISGLHSTIHPGRLTART